MADSERVLALLRRWRKAEGDKWLWNSHWDDLARVQLPTRQGFITTTSPGERRTDDIFDGTPMQAAIGLANAVGGMLRPEGEQWFYIRTDDENLNKVEEAGAWLHDSEKRLMKALDNPKARFRQSSGEIDLDLAVLGTGCQFIGDSKDLRHLMFQSLHLKDITVIFSDEGVPEGVFIRREFTLRNAESRFTAEALSDATRQKLSQRTRDDAYEDKVVLLHAILPRKEGRADALIARDLPYADIWIEVDARHEIQVSGYHEFPCVIPRWDTSSGETYGRSPGMVALPDSDTLQAQGETFLIAGQRAADPPLAVPNDSSFNDINTFPGGLAYYSTEAAAAVRGNPFFPLVTGANIPLTQQMQMDTRDQIRAAFYRNVLNLPVEGPQMTATEVIQRKEEFIREMGPVFGRLETDYPAPQIERSFGLMLRAGGFAPIPEVLQGKNVRFEFESPIKRIRQQVEAAAARLWVQEMVALSEVRPEALDLVNIEAYARFTHSAAHLPQSIIVDADTFEARQKQRNEAAEAEQQMIQMQQGAELAQSATGAVKQAVEATGGKAAA